MIDIVYPVETAPVMRGAKVTRASEMLPIVEPDGNVVAQAPRSYCHGPHKPLHPVIHLHIVDRQGNLYLQKRSMTKKLLPGRWDTAVGGHISYGESVQEALFREAGEELGFFDFNPIELDRYTFESDVDKELVFVFAAVGNFRLQPDNDEVSEGKYWTAEDLAEAIGKGVLTPNFELEYSKYKDKLISLL